MKEPFVSHADLPALPLWHSMRERGAALSFTLEATARCNNDCRHCYINLPAGDRRAQAQELSVAEIRAIANQAVSLGALWCLLTGGEPLLRQDFPHLYLALKRQGLLVSVFTNACLVTPDHVRLFREYPPRNVEVTVYGVSRQTYERVTRRPGSYAAFRRGLDLLQEGGVRVRLKAVALRSNAHELAEIARFCRARTTDYYRFDPLLHLRYDGDARRNREIRAERLPAQAIADLEQADEDRARALEKGCEHLIMPGIAAQRDSYLFHCGAGTSSFAVSYDGLFRLCPSLWQPDCLYDLRRGTLAEAWTQFVPQVRTIRSDSAEFLARCHCCPLVNLCLWCPAHAYLESGRMDAWCDHFCRVAHARAAAITARAERPEAEHAAGEG